MRTSSSRSSSRLSSGRLNWTRGSSPASGVLTRQDSEGVMSRVEDLLLDGMRHNREIVNRHPNGPELRVIDQELARHTYDQVIGSQGGVGSG